MIGFHDHVINRRSGRPEPHMSWQVERFATWIGWAMATISAVGAAHYYKKWGEPDGAITMLVVAIVFFLIAYAGQYGLERKKLKFRKAVAEYEALLAEAAHRTSS